MSSLTIGLLSDNHIPHRLKRLPETVLSALAGVDLILHAGDVDDPAALQPLRHIAPVHAVRGNLHPADLSDGGASLPAIVELELAGRRVLLTHGHPPGLAGWLLKGPQVLSQWLGLTDNGHLNRRIVGNLLQRYPGADVIVFGHSHRALVQRIGRALLVNPGAVCPTRGERPSVARLRLGSGQPEVDVVLLPR